MAVDTAISKQINQYYCINIYYSVFTYVFSAWRINNGVFSHINFISLFMVTYRDRQYLSYIRGNVEW
jgi:hypothetical protein